MELTDDKSTSFEVTGDWTRRPL